MKNTNLFCSADPVIYFQFTRQKELHHNKFKFACDFDP